MFIELHKLEGGKAFLVNSTTILQVQAHPSIGRDNAIVSFKDGPIICEETYIEIRSMLRDDTEDYIRKMN